jgi:orotate phosphoribosyltransferase
MAKWTCQRKQERKENCVTTTQNMINETVGQLLRDIRCIVSGHFVLKNADANVAAKRPTDKGKGDHSNLYVNKDWITTYPGILQRIAHMMAFVIWKSGARPKVIACPAVGAIAFAMAVCEELSVLLGYEVRFVYAEEVEKKKVFKRGGFAELLKDADVLVIEDIGTTFTSVKDVVDAVKACGGNVVCVDVMVARGSATAESLGVPNLVILYRAGEIAKWPAKECPLCRDGVKVNEDLGHGVEFKALGGKEAAARDWKE